jgi:plastocyanin
MRRTAAFLGVLVASALWAVPAPSAAPRAAARLEVTEKEYSITLSRLRVHSGRVIVQVLNFGMDNHDLVIQANAKHGKTWRFDLLEPESHVTRTMTLAPGKYTLFCSLPGHRALGMVAALTVTR